MTNPDEYEQDPEDIAEQNVETNMEAQEDYAEDNSPSYDKPDSLYGLFREVLVMEDSSKVGNLEKLELGMLEISVRDCQHIAQTAMILGEIQFAKWMTEQAQIILRTSASKKGWLPELFVTAKRFASKEKRTGVQDGTGTPVVQQANKGFWNKITGK